MMYYQWNNEIKKRLETHFQGIKDKLIDVQKITSALMKSDIKSEIEKAIARPFEKNTAKLQWDMIVRKNLAKSIQQAIDL